MSDRKSSDVGKRAREQGWRWKTHKHFESFSYFTDSTYKENDGRRISVSVLFYKWALNSPNIFYWLKTSHLSSWRLKLVYFNLNTFGMSQRANRYQHLLREKTPATRGSCYGYRQMLLVFSKNQTRCAKQEQKHDFSSWDWDDEEPTLIGGW